MDLERMRTLRMEQRLPSECPNVGPFGMEGLEEGALLCGVALGDGFGSWCFSTHDGFSQPNDWKKGKTNPKIEINEKKIRNKTEQIKMKLHFSASYSSLLQNKRTTVTQNPHKGALRGTHVSQAEWLQDCLELQINSHHVPPLAPSALGSLSGRWRARSVHLGMRPICIHRALHQARFNTMQPASGVCLCHQMGRGIEKCPWSAWGGEVNEWGGVSGEVNGWQSNQEDSKGEKLNLNVPMKK